MRHQSTSALIRVLVADDTRVHTELLADALKRDGCLQVTTSPLGSEGLTGRPNLRDVDVLLLGSKLDEQPGSGFEVLRGLQPSQEDLRAVMLLDSSQPETILEAFRAGAKGVFSRHESVEILSKCVRRVHEGQIWANSQHLAILLQSLASAHHVRAVDARGMNLLSKRELDVVRCVAQGLTNREIAERLGLSQHTIKNCLSRVFDKLGVSSRVELLFRTLSQDRHEQPVFERFLENHGGKSFLDEATLVACQKAAEQGVLIAQLALAQYYSARRASPSEALHTCMWYSVVHEQILRACKDSTNRMTRDQLLQAEQMAANWLNKRRKIVLTGTRETGDRSSDTGPSASSCYKPSRM